MTHRLSIIRFIVLIAISLSLRAIAQEPQPFEYGPRPPMSVFDPAGVLDPARVKEISDSLTQIAKNEAVDVVVVVLTDLKGAPPEYVASRFAKAWCTAPIHAVVLHVPNRQDSPWIVPLGKMVEVIKPQLVKEAVTNAQRHASMEVKDAEKVRTAANETVTFLCYWTHSLINRSEILRSDAGTQQLQQSKRKRMMQMAALLGLVAIFAVAIGISMIVKRRRKSGPQFFPTPPWQPRLGAPYTGGNHLSAPLASMKS